MFNNNQTIYTGNKQDNQYVFIQNDHNNDLIEESSAGWELSDNDYKMICNLLDEEEQGQKQNK